MVFRSIQGEMQMQGKKLQFDSANPEAGDALLRPALGPSVGAAFILIYNDKDEFTGVRDTGALAPAPDGNPSLAGIAQAQEVAELYRRSLEMGLPKSSVKVGDRWSSEEAVKFPSAGTVTVQLRAKLDAVVDYDERRHAKISFEGDMKSADAGVARETLADGSKSFGQVLFDLERGTISFAAFRADIILDIDGQKLPVRQQVTTKLAEFVPLQ